MKDDAYHVVPVNDIEEHSMNEDCKCLPIYVDGAWVHNAFDCRELIDDDNISLN